MIKIINSPIDIKIKYIWAKVITLKITNIWRKGIAKAMRVNNNSET